MYAPDSHGGPAVGTTGYGDPAGLQAAGEMVREAYRPHREDDDWGQAGTMVRQVLDDPPPTGWPPTHRPPHERRQPTLPQTGRHLRAQRRQDLDDRVSTGLGVHGP